MNNSDLYDKFAIKAQERAKIDVFKNTKGSKKLTIISYNSEGYREQELTVSPKNSNQMQYVSRKAS